MKNKRTICVDDYLAFVCVKCGPDNERHRIGLLESGSLAFFNHGDDSLTLEENLRTQGAMDSGCRCGEIHTAWIQQQTYQLPEGLRGWLASFRNRATERYQAARKSVDLLTTTTARQRAEERVRVAAEKTLARCLEAETYRTGDRHSNDVTVCQRIDGEIEEPAVDVYYDTERSYSYGDVTSTAVTRFNVRVPLGWYTRCYKPELGAINGAFVVDVVRHQHNGTLVRAIKQSRGYQLRLATALYTHRGALRWI